MTFVGRQRDDLDLPRCDGVGQPQNVARRFSINMNYFHSLFWLN